LRKNSKSLTNSDGIGKPRKARGPVQRDAKEVMAELVVKLSQKLARNLPGRVKAKSNNRVYLVPTETG
jgi:hypothetical protein